MFRFRVFFFGRCLPVFIVSLIVMVLAAASAFASTTITGTVYDKLRNPIINVDVELLDEYRRLLQNGGRTRTDGSGRYEFNNVPDGRFFIRVLALQYDLEDEERMVEIYTINIRGGEGVGYETQDFYLVPKKGGLREAELSVIFAQEVPRDAEKAFKRAEDLFKKDKKDEGMVELHTAITIFPDYYAALQIFGTELLVRERYLDAASVFMHATKVNPKSAVSFYNVGVALSKLGPEYYKAANTVLGHARSLADKSAQVFWLSGKISRELKNFEDAEKFLLRAKELADRRVPEIHKELAQLYANDLKKYALAADELENYLKASNLDSKSVKSTKQTIANLRKKAADEKGS